MNVPAPDDATDSTSSKGLVNRESGDPAGSAADIFLEHREWMIRTQLERRDITNGRVLEAMRNVRRDRFVAPELRERAYDDTPLPIGYGQTISQPYIVALMTQLIDPAPCDRMLEIGTGCGYQTAILAELCRHVFSLEIVEPLANSARQRLATLRYANVTARCGDGTFGWKDHGPFDGIVAAAAPDRLPRALVDQLKPNGRLALPVGKQRQYLLLIEKSATGTICERRVIPVSFVPMTGEAEALDGPSVDR